MEDLVWLAGLVVAFFVFWGFILLFDRVIGPDEVALTEGEPVVFEADEDEEQVAA